MHLDELSKQYNELSQQEANFEYRQGQLQKQKSSIDLELAKLDLDLAKIQGKKELLQAMAQEMQTADNGGPEGAPDERGPQSAVRSPQSRRSRHNGVVIPDPEPEEADA